MVLEPTVFIIDDSPAMRRSLTRLLESVGLSAESYEGAEHFLSAFKPERPGCMVLDVRMPGMSGLDLQERLARDGVHLPVLILSAHGDVAKAVRAMKNGAVDFLKKPCKGPVLLSRVREALELDARRRDEQSRRRDAAQKANRLTPREAQIMKLLVAGRTPKEIAFSLGLSRKTVDVHKGHIMTKMQADSLLELAQLEKQLPPTPDSADL